MGSNSMTAFGPPPARVHERREEIAGLEMVYEPRYLRFFQAPFRPLES